MFLRPTFHSNNQQTKQNVQSDRGLRGPILSINTCATQGAQSSYKCVLPVQNPTTLWKKKKEKEKKDATCYGWLGWGNLFTCHYMYINGLLHFLKPFVSPASDQNEFPPNIIHTLSRENVTRINKIIANGKISIKGYFADCRTPMLNDS